MKKRDDGIMLIDPIRAKGRRIWWRPVPTATSGGTRSCSCRRSGPSTPTSSTRVGSRPRAAIVSDRAMRAIKVEDDEMARMARQEGLGDEGPPNRGFIYRNLWRTSKCFIGGSCGDE